MTVKFHLFWANPGSLLMWLQMWLHVSFTAAQNGNEKNIWSHPDQTLLEDSAGRHLGFKPQQHLKSADCSVLHKASPASTGTWNPGQCREKGDQQGALNARPAEFWGSLWFFTVLRHKSQINVLFYDVITHLCGRSYRFLAQLLFFVNA